MSRVSLEGLCRGWIAVHGYPCRCPNQCVWICVDAGVGKDVDAACFSPAVVVTVLRCNVATRSHKYPCRCPNQWVDCVDAVAGRDVEAACFSPALVVHCDSRLPGSCILSKSCDVSKIAESCSCPSCHEQPAVLLSVESQKVSCLSQPAVLCTMQ